MAAFFRRSRKQSFLVLRLSGPGHDVPLHHVEQIFRYARLDYVIADSAGCWVTQLHAYTGLVFLPGTDGGLSKADTRKVEQFVKRGGGVFAILPGVSPCTRRLFGIVESDSPVFNEGRESPLKIRMSGDLFPGVDAVEIDHGPYQPGTTLIAGRDPVDVLASLTNGFPLIWQRFSGEGSVVVWNIDHVWGSQWRGLLLQAMLKAPAVSVQCMANAASIQIDDFPAGFADIQSPLLQDEFGLSFIPFLDQVWLPDMLRLGRELHVPFTCAIPFAYTDQVEAPFEFAEWLAVKLDRDGEEKPAPVCFARRLVDAGHELAMHGYNHVALKMDDWRSSEAISASLSAAVSQWESDDLGPLPRCYIPPMNHYDEEGIRAMSRALPEVRVICGAEGEDPAMGGRREFGPEPWANQLFCLPRWTYGYLRDEEYPLSLLSEISMLGVWTHFIHADDILDTETEPGQTWKARNEKCMGWRESPQGSLYEGLKRWIKEVQATYPWLRFYTATQAGDVVKQHLENKISVTCKGNHSLVLRADQPADCILRFSGRAHTSEPHLDNITLLHRYVSQGSAIYILRMERQTGIIQWKNGSKIM